MDGLPLSLALVVADIGRKGEERVAPVRSHRVVRHPGNRTFLFGYLLRLNAVSLDGLEQTIERGSQRKRPLSAVHRQQRAPHCEDESRSKPSPFKHRLAALQAAARQIQRPTPSPQECSTRPRTAANPPSGA